MQPSYSVIRDDTADVDVLVVKPAAPEICVLFAVGGGGDPKRHLPFLERLAASGCAIVAPAFERMASPTPDATTLEARARRLRLALDALGMSSAPEVGGGHSIGAAVLLMLAGARGFTSTGEPVTVQPERRIRKLALMAPATDFFRAAGALDDVTA